MRKKKLKAVKGLAKRNPRVNLEQLLESVKMTERLRKVGVNGPGYRIAPPQSGRRVQIVDDTESDPRTIRLYRPKDSY